MEGNEMILEIQDDPAFLLLTSITHVTAYKYENFSTNTSI
jgi:hypothetical protein